MTQGEVLFTGKRFRVERVVARGADGSTHSKEVVRHNGAVTILPILDDGRICLIENYRVTVEERLLELPAGTLEPGEDPDRAAERELAEETGYRAGRFQRLMTFYMSPGVLDERMVLYVATQLTPGPMALDASEDLRPRLLTWPETMELIRTGQIKDSKTLAGLLYYDKFGKAGG